MNKFFLKILNEESNQIKGGLRSSDKYYNNIVGVSKSSMSNYENDDFVSIGKISKNDRLNVINKFNFLSAENTDAQILLKLFVELGNKAFENFGENFFFFKYDFNNKEAFIARDHIGFNSIYYFQSESGLFLSSSIKFILEVSSKKFDINEKMVKNFLNLDPFSDEETFYKDIFKVPPSSSLLYKDESIIISKFQKFKNFDINDSEDKQIKDLKLNLKNAILRREEELDNNLGFLFSGGIDSSAVISFYKYFKPEKNLYAFSANYSHLDESLRHLTDEEEYQSEVFKKYEIKSRPFQTENLSTLSNLDFYLDLIGQPFFFPNIYLPNEAFKNAHANKINKMFNGSDGDTVISHGFEYFQELFLKFKWFKLFIEISKLSKNVNLSKIEIFKRTVINQLSYFNFRLSSKERHKEILKAPVHACAIEIQSLLADFYNIEEVYPFYNIDLINYCINVSPNMKINGKTRYILRQAIKNIVPEKNRNRNDKANLTHALIHSFLTIDKILIEHHLNNPNESLKNFIDLKSLKSNWLKLINNPLKFSTRSNFPSEIFSFVVMNRWIEIADNNYNKKS